MLAKDTVRTIERIIGYTFRDEALLRQAFTMPSYRNEHPDARDNLVLEFFGKMVLSHAVSEILLDRYTFRDDNGLVSYMQEEAFHQMHHNCVAESYLAGRMTSLSLEAYIIKGPAETIGTEALSELCESIAAAIYIDLDKNMEAAFPILTKLLGL